MPLKLTLQADVDRRLETLGEVIAAVSPDIDFAYVFGSSVGGRRTPRSDVDLAIHVSAAADPQALLLDVARAVTKHLGTDAVDIVLLNTAPTSLAGRVLTSRRVVLDRVPFARHRYESRTARLFQDFRIRERGLLARRHGHG
jgi:predicted nucleotidyltransferase